MDTSDTSDFESADEFFSDSEVDSAKGNSLKENNLSAFGIEGADRAKESVEHMQKVEQCWEPGMDYDEKSVNCVVKGIETMTHINENNAENVCIASEEPEMHPPPIKTTCWIPELHEANIKREPSNFVPGPPKFDRDGNPIVPKERNINDTDEDKQSITRPDDGGNKNNESSSKNQSPDSKMHIPRIKTTCWVPALNAANKKRLENEKAPPKPPTVDRDGNSIGIQEDKMEERKVLVSEEGSDNLWDTDETWDEKFKEPNLTKTCEKAEENVWKDDFGSWGDEEIWSNNEETSKKPFDLINNKSGAKREQPEPSEDNIWENDQWESLENDPQEIKQLDGDQNEQTWSNWGIFSVLNSVSQGLTTAIGVPQPEDLARQQHSAQNSCGSPPKDSFVGLGTLVSGVTKLVESTGTMVISGGLETLETIGKKTMEVLQENDPGLKKKRAFLMQIEPGKPVLSQVLREAKERAERAGVVGGRKERAVCYEILFDDYQGLVHLEALSMISRQCTIKLDTIKSRLSGAALTDLQETLDQVRELCELPTDDATSDQMNTITPSEFNVATLAAIEDLNVPISFAAFLEGWEEVLTVAEEAADGGKDVYRRAVETLARFTAMAVEQLHKGGELLLVKGHRSTVDEADGLVLRLSWASAEAISK